MEERSAETHNKIRSRLHGMFELATKPGAELWWGANPLAQVERRQPVKRLPTSLSAEEKALAVLREAAGDNLRRMLARLPPGRAASEAAAERLGEEAAQAARKGGA